RAGAGAGSRHDRAFRDQRRGGDPGVETVTDAGVVELLLDRRVAVPVIVVRDGTIASSNEAARELLHGDVGQAIEALVAADSRSKLTAALVAAPASCEVQARRSGKDPELMRVAVVPLGPDTRLVLVAHIGVEYSEPMAQQLLAVNNHLANLTRELSCQSAKIAAARARFESLADLREQFVSMLAHDVRAALQGIVLNVEVLERGDARGGTAPWSHAVARIQRSATRVVELVEKVLEAARTESGRITLDVQPVSLAAVARD